MTPNIRVEKLKGEQQLLKKSLEHYGIENHVSDQIQATSVAVGCWVDPITVAAVYRPPKHSISQETFETFFSKHGKRFIAGDNYNAKHTFWVSTLINPKERNFLKEIKESTNETFIVMVDFILALTELHVFRNAIDTKNYK